MFFISRNGGNNIPLILIRNPGYDFYEYIYIHVSHIKGFTLLSAALCVLLVGLNLMIP
jgi:hypothetical protein